MTRGLTFALALIATPLWAQDDATVEDDFVISNLLGIFYHELGHALIDILEIPVYGQEEDAADVASVLLIEWLYPPDVALEFAYDTALGFDAEALEAEDEGYEVAWWDVHGPDPQRFYNTVCLFYGADPDARDEYAADMELPEDRAETCSEEFDIAFDSWGAVFEGIEGSGRSMVYDGDPDRSLTDEVMAIEVEELNEFFDLPIRLDVVVDFCDEANAFYDPGTREIIMCIEFEDHMRSLYREWVAP